MSLIRLLFRLFLRSSNSRKLSSQKIEEAPLPPLRLPPKPQNNSQTIQIVTTVHAAAVTIENTTAQVPRKAEQKLVGKCYVVDGDTIYINKISIRLAGIDAPELDHPNGVRAKRALMRLTKGEIVTAEIVADDHHGRTVATCFLSDGRDLSAEMVKAGLAIDWPKYSGGIYRQFEPEGVRHKLWRCDARQKGRMPPSPSHPD